jgi:ubiquinone/menaquinone biosynthesis C-methylase UbiE
MALANRQPNRIAIDALDIASDDTVLEVGFGPGQALRILTALASAGRVLGIDHSAAMVAQAARRNRDAIRDGCLQLTLGPFDCLPWPAGSIDKILAVNVAYFFRADGADVHEARRVLRPGGRMAIYATDRAAMARWKFSGEETHRTVDGAEMERLLVRGGFEPHEIAIFTMTMPLGIPGLLVVACKGMR